jgi:ParB/RepB/Spo0J family partition protein
MAQSSSSQAIDSELLPNAYDKLLPAEDLIHGKHNPRRNTPSERLQQSISGFGINDPLIVRPDPDRDVYHITDGWQRYQAATQAGWERLPVEIYEDVFDALAATEQSSIVEEWSRYTRANYCCSVAEEFETEGDSTIQVARKVSKLTSPGPDTVRRYLDVLSLPGVVHILLSQGPDGTEQQWDTLKTFNEQVRQYGDLRWQVADRLAQQQSSLSESRVIKIAATAVEFDTVEQGVEFVDMAVNNPETRIDIIRRKILVGKDYDQYLIIPRESVKLSTEEKRAVFDYCHQQRRPLSEIVVEHVRSLAEDLVEEDCDNNHEDAIEKDQSCEDNSTGGES